MTAGAPRAVVVCVLAAACAGPPQRSGGEVAVGTWVEVQGDVQDGVPRVRSVTALERSESDKAEKMTITAPASADVGLHDTRLGVLGLEVDVEAETEFEDAEREPTPRFPIAAGDWVRVKTRQTRDQRVRAREVRQLEPRRQFEIEGELTGYDRARQRLTIGSLQLPNGSAAEVRWRDVDDDDEIDPNDPLALFRADDQKGVPFSIALGERVLLGGDLALKVERRDEYDLRRSRDRDRTDLSAESKLDLLWSFDKRGSFVLFEAKGGASHSFEEGDPDRGTTSKRISRAYAYWNPSDALRLQVGRQDFDGDREWLYDEILDGARVRWLVDGFDVEAFAAAGREFLTGDNGLEDNYFLGALARYHLDDDHRVTAYVLQRIDSNPRNFEPFLVGLRSFAKPWRGLGHWLELAHSSGYAGSTKIDGYGVDVGLMYRFDLSWRPTVAAGYALGTGEDDPGRMGFRQSGIQDNNGKFGGVTSFRYYGEVLEPELANLEVWTMAVGVRPHRRFSADVIAHVYRQDRAVDRLIDTKLRTRPNGTSTDLGVGVDLVLGYRPSQWARMELIAGRFDPGAAFDNNDAAHKLELSARFKF